MINKLKFTIAAFLTGVSIGLGILPLLISSLLVNENLIIKVIDFYNDYFFKFRGVENEKSTK